MPWKRARVGEGRGFAHTPLTGAPGAAAASQNPGVLTPRTARESSREHRSETRASHWLCLNYCLLTSIKSGDRQPSAQPGSLLNFSLYQIPVSLLYCPHAYGSLEMRDQQIHKSIHPLPLHLSPRLPAFPLLPILPLGLKSVLHQIPSRFTPKQTFQENNHWCILKYIPQVLTREDQSPLQG